MASFHTAQITIGAGTNTQFSPGGTPFASEVSVQNNAAHTIRVGDKNTSATQGALLASGAPGGSVTFGPYDYPAIDLSTLFVAGTQGDVVDVIWVD